MKKVVTLILTLCIISIFSEANPIVTHTQPNESFKPNQIHEQANKCSYIVDIKTSCRSPSFTANHVSIAFGDTYGSEVYVARLDGLISGSFEKCDVTTFEIRGTCTYDVCYLYLYTTGYDVWVPNTVTISGYNTATITFFFNTAIPPSRWHGFNTCNNGTIYQ